MAEGHHPPSVVFVTGDVGELFITKVHRRFSGWKCNYLRLTQNSHSGSNHADHIFKVRKHIDVSDLKEARETPLTFKAFRCWFQRVTQIDFEECSSLVTLHAQGPRPRGGLPSLALSGHTTDDRSSAMWQCLAHARQIAWWSRSVVPFPRPRLCDSLSPMYEFLKEERCAPTF